jgi:biotin carboxylase
MTEWTQSVEDTNRGGNTVLVIPGGKYQLPLIAKTKARGFRVACADRSPDCEGAGIADHFFQIGLNRREELLQMAVNLKPVAIATDQTDAGVAVVAWLTGCLGLPGIGIRNADLYTQKHRMREFGVLHGFTTPKYQVCESFEQCVAAAALVGYPVVIKPTDSQSSKGVHRIDNPKQLELRFNDAAQHATDGKVVIEQYLDGPEFTVEGFMTQSGHQTLAISQKKHYRNAPMVARSLEYCPDSAFFDYELLRKTHDSWVNESGLPFGMTHAEYKYADNAFQLIEIAARGGGTQISSDIVPWVSGIDYQQLYLDAAIGRTVPGIPEPLADRCALLEFFDIPLGRITAIKGCDEARSLPGVISVVLMRKSGDNNQDVSDDTTRPGYFIIGTNDRQSLTDLRDKVLNTIRLQVN